MVTFRYETPLLRVGAAVSLIGVLISAGLIAHERLWTRRTDRFT